MDQIGPDNGRERGRKNGPERGRESGPENGPGNSPENSSDRMPARCSPAGDAVSAMFLHRTISQLDSGPMPKAMARQLAQLGYMQWIASLPGQSCYLTAVRQAMALAAPFAGHSPAVAEFRALLEASAEAPLSILPLTMPPRKRRGGAQARRAHRVGL